MGGRERPARCSTGRAGRGSHAGIMHAALRSCAVAGVAPERALRVSTVVPYTASTYKWLYGSALAETGVL